MCEMLKRQLGQFLSSKHVTVFICAMNCRCLPPQRAGRKRARTAEMNWSDLNVKVSWAILQLLRPCKHTKQVTIYDVYCRNIFPFTLIIIPNISDAVLNQHCFQPDHAGCNSSVSFRVIAACKKRRRQNKNREIAWRWVVLSSWCQCYSTAHLRRLTIWTKIAASFERFISSILSTEEEGGDELKNDRRHWES